MLLIGLDPGGSTGWATYDTEYNLWCSELLGPHPHHFELYLKLCANITDNVKVISESFEYRNQERPGLELVSREYIGVAKMFCQRYHIDYEEQSASEGKVRDKTTAFVKPINLQRLELWEPGKTAGHRMDAIGHILYYITKFPRLGIEPKVRLDLLRRGWK